MTKEGEQYKWYKKKEKGIDPSNENSNFVKKPSTSNSASDWWLRSPGYKRTSDFCNVYSTGASNGTYADLSYGVAPSFCI